MIPVEEALEIVLREAQALPAEEVALDDALLRVLAEDVASDLDLPPFDRAAMDGYALRAADVAGAPVALEIVGEVRAGQWPDLAVGPGQAVRIMTGAPVPPGADAVQPVESTQPLDEFRVTIRSAVPAGANVAPRGSEARAGTLLLSRGRVIDPAAVAVLASAGKARVRVARRPVVALLVTGDEIVAVSDTPAPGQIRNSNGPAVAAQARLAGATVRLLGVAPDRQDAIAEALRAGLSADVARRLRRRLGRGLRPRRARPAGARGDVPLHEGGDQARGAPRLRAVLRGRSSSACPATPSPRR